MRALLVYPIREDFDGNRGIVNKMRSQARALSALAGDCHVLVNRREGVALQDQVVVRYRRSGPRWNTLNHYGLFYLAALQALDPSQYDLVYMRYPGSSPPLLLFLAAMRRRNPKLRVIVEVATYPFRQEMRSPTQRLVMLSDDIFSPALRLVVDLIVTFFGQQEIYGIPCVPTKNGIDVDSVPLRNPPPKPTNRLRLLAVANLAAWHAYDRVLRGMAADRSQHGTSRTSLDIVGDGPARAQLRHLVQELHLQEDVTFHGVRTGKDLDRLFDHAHVALGSFGMHRLALPEASSLKTREYAARGIPFVLAGSDDDFPEAWPWALHVPSNETNVDIGCIHQWYQQLPEPPATAAQVLRTYALEQLSWTAKLAPVLNRLSPAK